MKAEPKTNSRIISEIKGALNRNNRWFCCLGVLCEILKDEIKLDKRKVFGTNKYKYDYHDTFLPISVQKYAGMKNGAGHTKSLDFSLSIFNDNIHIKKNFDEIADIIEENYKEL